MSRPWEQSWEQFDRIGKGGQGVTYLVKSRSEGASGVLKHLLNNKSEAARGRMHREVAALQSLAPLDANVPKVLDDNSSAFAESGVELYLVMEFIDGPTLKTYVEKNGRLSIDQSMAFMLSLCRTVSVAHGEGVVHRDIKPDNIIVLSDTMPELYIVDYGLSFNEGDDDLTQTQEQFKNKFLNLPETNTPTGNRRDPRIDVTQLCGVFYYMLTGHIPGHLHDEQGRLAHLRPGYSVREAVSGDRRVAQIELLLGRGLAHQIQSRFQSIGEFAQAIELLQKAGGSGAVINLEQAAKDISNRLKEQDVKTRIADRRPAAEKLIEAMNQHTSKVAKTLG